MFPQLPFGFQTNRFIYSADSQLYLTDITSKVVKISELHYADSLLQLESPELFGLAEIGTPPVYSGLWSPRFINTQLWLDASDTTTITTNTSFGATSILDKSSNNYLFNNLRSAIQPLILQNAQNNRNTIFFERFSQSTLELPDSQSFFNNFHQTEGSIFIVAKTYNDNAIQPLYFSNNDGDPISRGFSVISSALSATRGDGSNFIYLANITQPIRDTYNTTSFTVKINDSIVNGYLNGSLETSVTNVGSPVLQNSNEFEIVARPNRASFELCEIIFLPFAADQELTDIVHGYLHHKWGLTGLLPIDHPYKTEPPSVFSSQPQKDGSSTVTTQSLYAQSILRRLVESSSNVMLEPITASASVTIDAPVVDNLESKTIAYFGFDNFEDFFINRGDFGYSDITQTNSSKNDFSLRNGNDDFIYSAPKLGSHSLNLNSPAGFTFISDVNELNNPARNLSTNGFIGFAFWIYIENLSSTYTLLQDREDSNDNFVLKVQGSSSRLQLEIISNLGLNITFTPNPSLTINTWQFINVEINKSTGQNTIRINNNTPVIGIAGSATLRADSQLVLYSGDYKIDGLYFYNAPLTTEEFTTLYNGGTGLNYPF